MTSNDCCDLEIVAVGDVVAVVRHLTVVVAAVVVAGVCRVMVVAAAAVGDVVAVV